MKMGITALFCLTAGSVWAGTLSAYQVMFETTDCNGQTGFASAKIEQIYRIEPAGCTGPDGKPIKKILLKNGQGSYDVLLLSDESAREVMGEIRAYMRAKRKMVENGNALVITH